MGWDKPEKGDIDLGSGVWLRWTQCKGEERSGALIFHKKDDGKLCWGSISLKNDPDAATRDTWEFNGNFEKPTLTPSVLCSCGLHGYVTDGIWKSC